MAISADAVTVELVAKTDGYNQKINAAAANTDAAMKKTEASVGRAENVINLSAARIANGQRNLGRQFADVGASLSSGSSPFVVLAQQLPQIADALTDTGGKAARFAAVLTGPVGAAGLAVASILATTLLPKLLETGDSAESLAQKLEDKSVKTRLSAEADKIFSRTQEGLRAAIIETTKALDGQNASLRTNAQLRNVAARQQFAAAQNEQQGLADRLASLRRREAQLSTPGASDARLGGVRTENAEALRRTREEIKQVSEDARQAFINVNRSRVYLAADNAAANATAQGRINRLYDDRVRAVQRAAIAEANAGKQIGSTTQQRIEAIERERQAALKAESDKQSASRRTASDQRASAKRIGDAAKTLSDLRRLASQATGAERDRLEKQVDRAQKRLSLLKDGVSSGAIAASLSASSAAGGKSAAQKFLEQFNREMGQTGADFARITDDATEAARRAARQFKAIFGEEGKDFPDPFANVKISDEARKVAFEQRAQDAEKLHRQEEQNIRSLADIYQSAFEGGVGGIWKQFKQEGIRAIALVLAQLTLGKSLGQALGSLGNTGGGSGNLGGIGSTIASLFAKRASGGDVSAGKIYHINEGGSRKELFQPAQSGKIYPTGALQAKQVSGGQSVFLTQTFTLDARGGITTPQLLQYVNQTARTEAARAGQTAYQASPARSARLQTLGT